VTGLCSSWGSWKSYQGRKHTAFSSLTAKNFWLTEKGRFLDVKRDKECLCSHDVLMISMLLVWNQWNEDNTCISHHIYIYNTYIYNLSDRGFSSHRNCRNLAGIFKWLRWYSKRFLFNGDDDARTKFCPIISSSSLRTKIKAWYQLGELSNWEKSLKVVYVGLLTKWVSLNNIDSSLRVI
jgi:hypothetical protein